MTAGRKKERKDFHTENTESAEGTEKRKIMWRQRRGEREGAEKARVGKDDRHKNSWKLSCGWRVYATWAF